MEKAEGVKAGYSPKYILHKTDRQLRPWAMKFRLELIVVSKSPSSAFKRFIDKSNINVTVIG